MSELKPLVLKLNNDEIDNLLRGFKLNFIGVMLY